MINLKNKAKINDEVSVTNLIDVLFVLLIMFMITAGAVMHSNVKIDLPMAVTQEEAHQAEIEILIARNDKIYFANKEYEITDLEKILEQMAKERNTNQVVIKADAEASYGKVMEVMDTSRIAGLDSLSLAIQEQPNKK